MGSPLDQTFALKSAGAPRVRRRVQPPELAELWSMRPRVIWAWLKTQAPSFWFLSLYLVFEYLHPQIIYPIINVLPWGYTLMLLTGIALLLEGKAIRLPTVIGGLMVLYSAVVLLSSMAAWSPSAAFAELPRYFDWLWAYLLITNVVRTERQFLIFMLLFLLCSFKMSSFGTRTWALRGFSFADWGLTGSPVWFQNSGEFGVQMCVFFPVSVSFYLALRKYWRKWEKFFFLLFPVTAVLSMIGSSSRGALVGGALALGWMVARTRYRVRAAVAAIILVVLAIALVPPEQKARFSAAGTDDTSQSRLTAWHYGIDLTERYPVLGIGFRNWSPYRLVDAGTPLLPHNIFIEVSAELGFAGLVSFLLLISATFWVNYRTRKIFRSLSVENDFIGQMAHGLDGALIGYLGSGFWVTVVYYPFFWINLALTVTLHMVAVEKACGARARAQSGGYRAASRPHREHRALRNVGIARA